MNKSQESQIGSSLSTEDKSKTGEVLSKTFAEPKLDVIRFWSSYDNHQVAAMGRNIKFKEYVVLLKADDPDVVPLRKLKCPYIREVVDRPFEDEASLAKFNKFLGDLIFTGERGEASRRGIRAVRALFDIRECDDCVLDGQFDPNLLIMRAIKSKSFKGGI